MTDDRYHAIYLVLNEETLFAASLASIYDHVSGVTVITSYDHDRYDHPIRPDGTVARLLSRELDPDRKVNVIICAEGSEVALRNRAMSFVKPPGRAGRRSPDDPSRWRIASPDWFWIVDADEIWTADDISALKRYIGEHPASVYEVTADNYWRSWNWRIEQRGSYVSVVAPGTWFEQLRHPGLSFWQRLVRKADHLGLLPEAIADRFRGVRHVPRAVAVFHHGSYLGTRERIEAKFAGSGHRDQHLDRWLDDVWDAWTPAATDLHPFDPSAFPVARHIPTDQLPDEITGHPWPGDWLEPATP